METITTRSGWKLRVEKRIGEQIEVALHREGEPRCLLHWGLRQPRQTEWQLPPPSLWPEGTTPSGPSAVQTPLPATSSERGLTIQFPPQTAFTAIEFVLFFPDEKRWDNNHGRNYRIELSAAAPPPAIDTVGLSTLADEIIRAETGHNSWTLMHRFNLCHDLLDRARGDTGALALLFVWLRFSAVRQLTWQRNYNTQPRELSHAQDRLTHKLAALYRNEPAARPLVRLMLTTVGRGGEGQRVRDEILQIMHRHHIKEVSGHFLEEWHQKLHNNTTPDDLVICSAYIEFLRSHGHRDRFYQVLREGGVTKERLENFERPIRSHPDFVPHLKDALIHDFENFLRTLKSVHAGADFETARNAARPHLDGGLNGLLDLLWHRRHDAQFPLVELVDRITDARRGLAPLLAGHHAVRELLYLDVALENLLRAAVERNIHLHLSGDQLTDLIARVIENLALTQAGDELAACLRHWERLKAAPRFSAPWSLHAKAVLDRIGRALGDHIDRAYQLLQPKAEFLGQGFHAEPWTITLFSEEVVRGSSLGFVLSMLLHHLDPLLRQAAQLGDWQVISRGSASGQVEVVESLRSIQGKSFATPRIVIADKVGGDEEIPEGVTAVIAPDVTDIVSHVAVRARNAHLLFATCYDPATLQRLKSLTGRQLHLEVNAAGDVVFEETSGAAHAAPSRVQPAAKKVARPKFTTWAVSADEFNERIVGGKSNNQTKLRGKLPDWIRQPASVALPFGVCERVLSLDQNKPVAERCAELLRGVGTDTPSKLAELRETMSRLTAPEELMVALRVALSKAGLEHPPDWNQAWSRIKQVWASKWNERAFLSRQANGLAHDDLFMAVLIQQVVEADYAFVIHTVNPMTGNRDELYAEVVLGLGETLVGNYPGRALSVVCDKKTGKQTLLAYPGKSLGLFGGGWIFRSDSNGEDLAGYAGAGLYDSVLLAPPRPALLDYSQERLVWDENFRNELLKSITQLALAVEAACGSPQDIEGAVAQGQFHLVQTRPQVGV